MGESLVFHPDVVRTWGGAARRGGSDIREARAKVVMAAEDVQSARMMSMVSSSASDAYMSRVKQGVGQVGDDVTGTGDKLVETVAVVRSTDDKSADLFRRWGGPA